MIAVKARLLDGWELLSDEGLLHQLAHHMQGARSPSFGRVADLPYTLARDIVKFEREVPGVHPCWAAPEGAEVPLDDMPPPLGRLDLYAYMDTRAQVHTKRLSDEIAVAAERWVFPLRREREGVQRLRHG